MQNLESAKLPYNNGYEIWKEPTCADFITSTTWNACWSDRETYTHHFAFVFLYMHYVDGLYCVNITYKDKLWSVGFVLFMFGGLMVGLEKKNSLACEY